MAYPFVLRTVVITAPGRSVARTRRDFKRKTNHFMRGTAAKNSQGGLMGIR
jgi:hypothetical protein